MSKNNMKQGAISLRVHVCQKDASVEFHSLNNYVFQTWEGAFVESPLKPKKREHGLYSLEGVCPEVYTYWVFPQLHRFHFDNEISLMTVKEFIQSYTVPSSYGGLEVPDTFSIFTKGRVEIIELTYPDGWVCQHRDGMFLNTAVKPQTSGYHGSWGGRGEGKKHIDLLDNFFPGSDSIVRMPAEKFVEQFSTRNQWPMYLKDRHLKVPTTRYDNPKLTLANGETIVFESSENWIGQKRDSAKFEHCYECRDKPLLQKDGNHTPRGMSIYRPHLDEILTGLVPCKVQTFIKNYNKGKYFKPLKPLKPCLLVDKEDRVVYRSDHVNSYIHWQGYCENEVVEICPQVEKNPRSLLSVRRWEKHRTVSGADKLNKFAGMFVPLQEFADMNQCKIYPIDTTVGEAPDT